MTDPTRLVLVVRAHLPWVPPAEDDDGPDARALYDLVTDRLMPLLSCLEGLAEEEVPYRITLAPSPTLLALLSDDWARAAIVRRAKRMRALATSEADRFEGRLWGPLGEWYEDRLLATVDRLADPAAGDVVASLGRLADAGGAVIAAAPATAAIDGLIPELHWRRAQHRVAAADLSRRFGAPREAYGRAPPAHQVQDLGVLGLDPAHRDPESDIVWERELPYLRPYVAAGPERTPTGLSYRRRGKGGDGLGLPWAPELSRVRALEQAGELLRTLAGEATGERPPVVVAGFDLSGPGWYELPWFLEGLFRGLAAPGSPAIATTVAEVEAAGLTMPGAEGSDDPLGPYLTPPCDWTHRHLAEVRARMDSLVVPAAGGPMARACQQAGREALLAHAGDWLDRMRAPEVLGGGAARFEGHVRGFLKLSEGIAAGAVDEVLLDELELMNPVFPELDVAGAFSR